MIFKLMQFFSEVLLSDQHEKVLFHAVLDLVKKLAK